MEIYIRRVYASLVGVLFVLWLGMLAWVVLERTSGSLPAEKSTSLFSLESGNNLKNFTNVSGIRFSTYFAMDGDTFLKIANRFNLSESTLRSLNQANDKSEPSKSVPILVPSKDGIFHIVRSGQDLSDISRCYGVSLKKILQANQKRAGSNIEPGEILYLPEAPYLTSEDVRWAFLVSLETKKGFLKPTTGRFADGYGKRKHPITGKVTFHEGLDLAPGWRARVVASQGGLVVFASIRAGYGRLIILDHGEGLSSWYAHLDEILVKTNQQVKRGQLIGKVGKSGKVTGPHLHFEVRLNGRPKNPFLYLVQ